MKPVILDVDTGIDDALAITYAVRSPELEVLGITTSFGNISLEDATSNTLFVLEHLESPVPVIPGADKPLYTDGYTKKATFIHGEDGIGQTRVRMPKREADPGYAPRFIIDQVRSRPNGVTVITVGPLTNLALAIMEDPEIVNLVDEVIVMGGAVRRRGNVTPAAEANIYADPNAAEYVFRSGIPVTLVGLDVTMQTLLQHEKLQLWRDADTELSRLLADMTDFYIQAYKRLYPDVAGCGLHDPLAVGVAISSDFVKKVPLRVRVELEDMDSIGRTVEDRQEPSAQPPNMEVCLEVDAERFLAHFLSRVV